MLQYRFFILIIFSSLLISQAVKPEISFEKQKLLILPSKGGAEQTSIENTLTQILASEATSLGRYNIIDRNQLEKIMQEQALQMTGVVNDSDLVNYGRISGAKEGMILDLLNFHQKGVPPGDEDEKETNFFDVVINIIDITSNKKEVEKYPNNIQTVITLNITKIDIETGKSLEAYYIDVEHTGGNLGKSLKSALAQVRSRLSLKMRSMFTLTSQVVESTKKEVTLFLGSDMGVKRGTLFEISSLDEKREFQGREISMPGRSVALVRVADLSADANRAIILRKWGDIKAGYKATEKIYSMPAGMVQFFYGSEQGDYALLFKGIFKPFNRINYWAGFQLGMVKDDREDMDFMLGIPIGLTYNLIHTPAFSLGGSVSIPFNLVFRRDDEDHSATAFYLDPRIGLESTIMSNPKRDWFIGLEYVFSAQTSSWTWTETKDDKPKTHSADWTSGTAPSIEPSGLYLSGGIRFLVF